MIDPEGIGFDASSAVRVKRNLFVMSGPVVPFRAFSFFAAVNPYVPFEVYEFVKVVEETVLSVVESAPCISATS